MSLRHQSYLSTSRRVARALRWCSFAVALRQCGRALLRHRDKLVVASWRPGRASDLSKERADLSKERAAAMKRRGDLVAALRCRAGRALQRWSFHECQILTKESMRVKKS
ncbi:uncharacterized protein A4U43_C06F18190 [Asparagus officinalis]|uniref:Uncharacterized protein n=1 Tax=Asparagus officinalis TaxID=4686 RepID=A0A5P1ET65_ASPOF|nr:uncharacterized protein A4U43_C06F18190 [Asparagus officinalis]